MIAPLRRAHRTIWTVLAVCLPLFLAVSLASREPTLEARGKAVPPSEASEGEIIGCWGTLPVRLTVTPIESPGPIRSPEGGLHAPLPGAQAHADPDAAALGASTSMELSDGNRIPLSDNVLVHLLEEAVAVARIDILAPPRHPALFAYWIPRVVQPGPGLGRGGERLDSISSHRPLEIAARAIPAGGASLVLYSLAHDETVGVIHLRPHFIALRSCR